MASRRFRTRPPGRDVARAILAAAAFALPPSVGLRGHKPRWLNGTKRWHPATRRGSEHSPHELGLAESHALRELSMPVADTAPMPPSPTRDHPLKGITTM